MKRSPSAFNHEPERGAMPVVARTLETWRARTAKATRTRTDPPARCRLHVLAGAIAVFTASHAGAAAAQGTLLTPFLCQGGSADTYTVPAGVSQVFVVTAGGTGGNVIPTKPRSAGAMVSAPINVVPNQTLVVQVGCGSRRAIDSTGGRGGPGYGQGGDGGSSASETSNGAGGGGATAILDDGGAPLLVAGGGGGSGGVADSKAGGRGGKGSRKGGNGTPGASGGAGGKGGGSALIGGAPGWRSAGAGSGGGGGGGYGASIQHPGAPPVFVGGGGGGETAAADVIGGGGGGGGGASFAAPSIAHPRYGSGKGPLGDGFAAIVPYKPWKPAPFVAVFSCKKGKAAAFTVPPGVEQLTVVVSGAGGGTPFNGTPAEGGARVTGTVPVAAGSKLSVIAGCQGLSNGTAGRGFQNGVPGAGAGLSGGGGGSSALLSGNTPLIVAGGGSGGGVAGGSGGGGGGSASSCDSTVTCTPAEAVVNAEDGTVLVMAVPAAAVTIPDPPAGLTAVAGLGEATVSFTAPADTGNSPITSYTVTATNDAVSETGGASPITVTGLTEGGIYAFTVTAINAKGASVPSVPSNTVEIPLPPGPPTDVSAVAGDSEATVSFNPPVDDGGSAITAYTATASPGGQMTAGPGSPLTVTGLSNGTAYTISVQATNVAGTGPAASSNPVTPGP